MSRGSYFGETEILFNRYHKYKYIAENDLKLYTLDADIYLQLLEKFPHLKEIFKIRAWHKNQVFHEINVIYSQIKGRNEESDYRRKREIRLGIKSNKIKWARLVKSD